MDEEVSNGHREEGSRQENGSGKGGREEREDKDEDEEEEEDAAGPSEAGRGGGGGGCRVANLFEGFKDGGAVIHVPAQHSSREGDMQDRTAGKGTLERWGEREATAAVRMSGGSRNGPRGHGGSRGRVGGGNGAGRGGRNGKLKKVRGEQQVERRHRHILGLDSSPRPSKRNKS